MVTPMLRVATLLHTKTSLVIYEIIEMRIGYVSRDTSRIMSTSLDNKRSISRHVASLNILVHDVINYHIINTDQTSENIFTYEERTWPHYWDKNNPSNNNEAELLQAARIARLNPKFLK